MKRKGKEEGEGRGTPGREEAKGSGYRQERRRGHTKETGSGGRGGGSP